MSLLDKIFAQQRPSFGERFSKAAQERVFDISRFLGSLSPDETALRAFSPELHEELERQTDNIVAAQTSRPEAVTLPERAAEILGSSAPDVALTAATGPLGGKVSALAKARGAGQALSTFAGLSAESAALAPIEFGTRDPVSAGLATIFAPVAGTVLSRIFSRIFSGVPSSSAAGSRGIDKVFKATPEQISNKQAIVKRFPVLFHGANAEGTLATEATGTLGSKTETVFLTHNRGTAAEFARKGKGKVFAVRTEDIPAPFLEDFDAGPIGIQSGINIPILQQGPQDIIDAIIDANRPQGVGEIGKLRNLGPSLEKVRRNIQSGKPFTELKGSPQRLFDTIARKSLRNFGLNKTQQDQILFSTTSEERVALALEHTRGVQEAAQEISAAAGRVLDPATGTAVAKPKAPEVVTLADILESKKASASLLSGEEGFFAIGRNAAAAKPPQAARLANAAGAIQASKGDDALAIFYNSLLINPTTIVRNMIGSTAEFVQQVAERGGRGFLRGDVSQAFSQFSGLGHGLTKAWQDAGEAFRSGLIKDIRVAQSAAAQAAAASGQPVPSASIARFLPASKILSATDDFFTSLAYYMDLHDRVYRTAWKQGNRGKALSNAVAKMLNAVPEELSNASMAQARRVVFRDLSGKITEKTVYPFIQSIQNIPVVGRLILPFGPTLFRIGKRTLEYTPLNYFRGLFQALGGNFEEGGLSALRATYGTVAMSGLGYLAWNDQIVGEGKHLRESQRAVLRKSGWQPFSVKIGDQYWSYRNLGPISGLLQMVSNTVEDMKESAEEGGRELITGDVQRDMKALFEEAARNAFGVGNSMEAAVEATFLPGVLDIANAIMDPDTYGEKGVKNLFSFLQPSTGLASLARAIDPVVRDVKSENPVERVENLLKSRTPVESKELRPRLGLFGEEIRREGTALELFLSPVSRTRLTEDPVIQELARLKVGLTPPSISIPFAPTQKLNLDEDFNARKAMGLLQRKFVTRVIDSEGYRRSTSDDVRTRMVTNAHNSARLIINLRLKNARARKVPITQRALLQGLI